MLNRNVMCVVNIFFVWIFLVYDVTDVFAMKPCDNKRSSFPLKRTSMLETILQKPDSLRNDKVSSDLSVTVSFSESTPVFHSGYVLDGSTRSFYVEKKKSNDNNHTEKQQSNDDDWLQKLFDEGCNQVDIDLDNKEEFVVIGRLREYHIVRVKK